MQKGVFMLFMRKVILCLCFLGVSVYSETVITVGLEKDSGILEVGEKVDLTVYVNSPGLKLLSAVLNFDSDRLEFVRESLRVGPTIKNFEVVTPDQNSRKAGQIVFLTDCFLQDELCVGSAAEANKEAELLFRMTLRATAVGESRIEIDEKRLVAFSEGNQQERISVDPGGISIRTSE